MFNEDDLPGITKEHLVTSYADVSMLSPVRYERTPWGGYVANQEDIEIIISAAANRERKLDPRVFKLAFVGSRMLIIRDLPQEEFGSIIIPSSVAEKEPPGAGWIVAIGDKVGTGSSPHPHGVYVPDEAYPSALLGRRVLFGMWSGKELNLNAVERGPETKFWVTTDRDIWAIDMSNQ